MNKDAIGIDPCEPPLGAHLVTPRLGYTHHGIYVGAGRVVHYAGLSGALLRGPVEEVPLALFARGRPVAIKRNADARYSPEEIVARARSRLGENGYRVTTNNCEHLCEWCVAGEARSEQVERLANLLRRALPAVTRRLGNAFRFAPAGAT